MGLGIECLLTDSVDEAKRLAAELDQINRERKNIESDMLEQSLVLLDKHLTLDEEVDETSNLPNALTIYDGAFHEGVIGILASRMKDKLHRPVFVFAPATGAEQIGLIKGSGRSIDGLHLRDALDLIEKRHPGMLLRFGGHAMAAGCTMQEKDLGAFNVAFNEIITGLIDAQTLNRTLTTDGALPSEYCTPQTILLLKNSVWGNGFPPPIFSESMKVLSQRIVGEKHLALKLSYHDRVVNAIWFRRTAPVSSPATLAYQAEINEWQGTESVQFVIQGMQSL
ncbi:MAG: DHHA1 domain-containing protein, partial [Saezia sp.]